MHQSSYDKMKLFCEEYLSECTEQTLRILDLGSQDVNGSYRAIFDAPNWQYIGIDMVQGDNVDVVVEDPYRWREITSNLADVVISGQALEHIEFFWLTFLEISRILKPGGIACIIAPSGGPEHKYPVDCWRFYPDGLCALAKYAGLETLSVATQWDTLNYEDGSDVWHDSKLVCRKPVQRGWQAIKSSLRRYLRQKALLSGQ